MTVPTCLYLIAMGIAVLGGEAMVLADDDVTIVPTPGTTPPPSQEMVAEDGTPVIHKSLHKKKRLKMAKAPEAPAPTPAAVTPAVAVGPSEYPPTVVVTVTNHPHSVAPSQPVAVTISPAPSTPPLVAAAPTPSVSLVPTVETGLPVARYPGVGTPISGVSTYIPLPAKTILTSPTHAPYYASILPTSLVPMTSSAAGSYSAPSRVSGVDANFVFTNYVRKSRNSYPWKTGIITTRFWIGEGGSSVSSTDNIGSAWDEHWRSTNHGNDDPDDRNGFASADHASTVNPFYVALPFNDLAFPDKASEWVPRSWHRSNEDGKQVSACKDRWVWIKNSNGRSCFAQWEDVGPLRYDHAEYVFGDERPIGLGDDHAGLDVSPAVWQYLGLDEDKRATTSWRFVDDEDVPPGQWLKYDEQAVIFTAMHQLRNSSPSSDLPIQRATEPIDDQSIDSNKKKVDASKG
jgi:hypothetical protein